jgi:hypothetical protein
LSNELVFVNYNLGNFWISLHSTYNKHLIQ